METNLVEVLSRLAHILGAIALFGGAIFTRFALIPAAKDLPEEAHASFKERLFKKWRMLVGMFIGLLILTGFYNFIAVAIPEHKGDGHYHMLMGIKILIAFVIFFIASVLPGRAKAFEGMRKNASKWLMITILLATSVVAIASYLKVRGPAVPEPPIANTAP